MNESTTKSATRVGAALLILVGAAHVGVNSFNPVWDEWLTGAMRSADVPPELVTGFWALPGSFAVVMIALGVALWSAGVRGLAAVVVGTLLVLWAGFCLWVVGMNPAFVIVVVAGLLIAAAGRRPTRSVNAGD